jgi:hypothetical protein
VDRPGRFPWKIRQASESYNRGGSEVAAAADVVVRVGVTCGDPSRRKKNITHTQHGCDEDKNK